MDNFEIVFESERIYFCKLSELLIDDYLKMINNPDISRCISINTRTYTYEEEQEWVQERLSRNAVSFSMIDKETNKFIGNIELRNVVNDTAEVGICITEDMQDKHFGTEAMKAIVKYGYEELNLEGIYLMVFNFNKRAIKCYENAGFVMDGPGKYDNDYRMVHRR